MFSKNSKPHQVIPVTVQSLPDSSSGGYKDIGLSGFDFLNSANIQVSPFGEFLLRNFPVSPNAAHVATKCFKLLCNDLIHYGTLWRANLFDRTAQQGVIFRCFTEKAQQKMKRDKHMGCISGTFSGKNPHSRVRNRGGVRVIGKRVDGFGRNNRTLPATTQREMP